MKLTTAEEEVMQFLWQLKEGMVRDILDLMPEPKPAYNTVSTIVRILEKKGFVDHKAYGNTHVYFPVVEKAAYAKSHFSKFLNDYFGNSFAQLTSFFAEENSLTTKDLEEILQMTKQGKEFEK